MKLQGGALEGSNVNVVEAMVGMISLARQFDMQMKILQNADAQRPPGDRSFFRCANG